MRKINSLLFIIFALLFVVVSCSEKDDLPKTKEETINPVSQFVYDGLLAYYLWTDEMANKKPTIKDTDPEEFFESVLYKTDTDNGWSWITDDAKGLVAESSGEPIEESFGYSLKFIQLENNIYAFIKYVFPNTPASDAGLQRLDLIGKVNGKPITTETGTNLISQRDIDILYGSSAATFTIYKLTDDGVVVDKDITVAPAIVKTDPVLFDEVYSIGNKKIGYLFYTSFTGNYNDRLFDVFNKFRNENVTDLVIDLRYNLGGGLDAASYLVSLFAPRALVEEKEVLTTLTFNKFLNELYNSNRWSRNTRLGTYQKEDVYKEDGKIKYKAAPNPLGANLNLSKVYIIATGNSASASELTTFCSRSLMGETNVIHIGEKTSGKYTASFTVHPYDQEIGNTTYKKEDLTIKERSILKNWAMQPIVAIYTDKNGKDFINPGYLEPDFQLQEGHGYMDYWKPIGDPEDVFLGQALYMITGNESYKPIQPMLTRSNQKQIIEIKSRSDNAKPLIIDNIKLTPEDINEIKKMRKLVN